MRWRPFTWMLLSVACFVGALYFWQLGNEWRDRQRTAAVKPAPAPTRTAPAPTRHTATASPAQTGKTGPIALLAKPKSTNAPSTDKPAKPAWLKFRVSNTTQTIGQLAHSDHAILLENALIDTRRPLNLGIPDSLRAKGDPGAYIVQAQGPIDNSFRSALAAAGAQIVSYIPNNAYLVRASSDMAYELSSNPQTKAVVPFEPYYKLSPTLLKTVMEDQVIPASSAGSPSPAHLLTGPLNVLVFGNSTPPALAKLGTIVAQAPSPFGRVVTLENADVPAVAALPQVQRVEPASKRELANDLSRNIVGVSSNSVAPDDYMGLTGTNVIVQVNDTGVDTNHPALSGGRVFGTALFDSNGHGTHVAGTIAGDGAESLTVTNALGSIMPPSTHQFRGMAPGAELYSLPFTMNDFDLQQLAARTNALISNNSWTYANNSYNIAAASYDQAVRDALPTVTGSQPVLFVFAAGDDGNGNDNGLGGNAESIQSPGTAKNVITVGATELPRFVTNDVVVHGQTNQPWSGLTDSSNEVTRFSARGNVGIQVEGDYGRFKPDVVAPGAFVVSARSTEWDTNAYYNPTNYDINVYTNQVVETNAVNNYAIFVPQNAVQVYITVTPISPTNVTDLPIYVSVNAIPSTNSGGYDLLATNQVSIPPDLSLPPANTIFYSIANPTTNTPVQFNVRTEIDSTNDVGNYYDVLRSLNDQLGRFYRYESGTSMSAADVSGVLALIQDFFINRLQSVPSPALLKAMLINGARSVNRNYDLQVRNNINYQGWGMINLTNSIPISIPTDWTTLTNGPSPMLLFDQDPTSAVATGDRRTIFVSVDPTADGQPLRITLVWTDPPGNPAAAIKLVNNLDLVVTNLDTGEVFFGNDIGSGNNFTFPWNTNGPPTIDDINNVENVLLSPTLGTNYSITVFGHAVNVNAVTAQTNNVVQDYALVVSSDSQATNALSITPSTPSGEIQPATIPNVTAMTNEFVSTPGVTGQLLLNQHVGANTPLLGTNTIPVGTNTMWSTNGDITLGMTNQWHFYMITNTEGYSNAVFATLLPNNLGLTPMGVTNYNNPANAARVEADIDLYVSDNPDLTNLVSSVVDNATKSVSRNGTEVIPLTLANPEKGQVFYAGVKSEDQEAAEYAFFGAFSQEPFSTMLYGSEYLHGINLPANIPDGSPALPGVARVLAVAVYPIQVQRVVVTNDMIHQNFGDLQGALSHNGRFAVLNNHTFPPVPQPYPLSYQFVYEDNGQGDIPNAMHTDGPGSLENFVGEDGTGLWLLTEMDTALTHVGLVSNLWIRLDPSAKNGGTNGVVATVQPGHYFYDALDVPAEATNFSIITYTLTIAPLPLRLYVKYGDFPTTNSYDYFQSVTPGITNILSINEFSSPPLRPGRYYVGIYNPNSIAVDVQLIFRLDLSAAAISTVDFTQNGSSPIPDDAVSYSTINISGVPDNVTIAQAQVGVAIQHPRISDLVLTLISPSGQRILLMENRGATTTNGIGGNTIFTNVVGTAMQDGFENGVPKSSYFAPANFSGGWFLSAGSVDLYPNGFNGSTAYEGNHYVDGNGMDPGTISTNFATIPGQQYRLSFAYTRNPDSRGYGITPEAAFKINNNTILTVAANQINTWSALGWQTTSTVFTATSPMSQLEVQGLTPGAYGVMYDAFKVEQLDIHPNYLVFTDDTNLTDVPIKFALPPYNGLASASNFTFSAFDPPTLPGDYTNTMTVDGWTVVTNQVSVINDLNAYSPPQFLALANGVISNLVTVAPNAEYNLSLAYRGPGIVGWWRGERNAPGLDSVGTNDLTLLDGMTIAQGEVGSGFSFNGGSNDVSAADSPGLNVGANEDFSIDTWIQAYPVPGNYQGIATIVSKREAPDTITQLGYVLYLQNGILTFQMADTLAPYSAFNFSGGTNLDDGVFHHVAVTVHRSSTTGGHLYVDGKEVLTFDPTVCPGSLSNTDRFRIGNPAYNGVNTYFNGVIDETSLYKRALSASEIQAIYADGHNGKFDPNLAPPENLAEAQVSLGGLAPITLYGANTNWQIRNIPFTAITPSIPLTVTGLEPGMLLDNFTISKLPAEVYVLPEQALGGLSSLIGQSPNGTWTLEIRDARTGAVATNNDLVSWQLQFILSTNLPAFSCVTLTNMIPLTNTIPPCLTNYYCVDVPSWATAMTNVISAQSPVNVWFNQNTFPTGNPAAGDILLTPNPVQAATIVLTSNSVPPLVPGATYHLGIESPEGCSTGTEVTNVIEADVGIITLTNMIPYYATNSPVIITNLGIFNTNDYYRFVIPTNAVRAQFEINNPSGEMALVVRKGWPPPQIDSFDYVSETPGTNDQLIVVFTNSAPVPLSAGDWYLTAVNLSGTNVTYSIMASWWTNTGLPITVTGVDISSNSFCITWSSLPLVHYFIQGVPALTTNMQWVTIVPDIRGATNSNTTTYCIPLPSGYHFFRVGEGIIPTGYLPPVILLGGITVTNVVPTCQFQYYSVDVPATATAATNTIVFASAPVNLWFNPTNYPTGTNAADVELIPNGTTGSQFILTTNSIPPLVPGSTYYLGVENPCSNGSNVVVSLRVDLALAPPPPTPPAVIVSYVPGTGFLLQWTGPITASYQVEWTDSLSSPWTTVPTVITSPTGQFTFLDDGSQTAPLGPARFYRVVQLP